MGVVISFYFLRSSTFLPLIVSHLRIPYLEAYSSSQQIHLSVVTLGQQLHRHITPLSELQKHILSLWDLSPTLYDQLGATLLETDLKMTEP